MSATLEFFSLAWPDLRAAIGRGSRAMRKEILESFEPRVEDLHPPEAFGGGPDLDGGLRRLLGGEVPPSVVSLGDALAFRCLVEHLGRRMGGIAWSGSGEKVEAILLGAAVQKQLAPPFPMTHLLWRPILGYSRVGKPTWGGLSASELEAIAPRLASPAPEWTEDLDVDAWIPELWDALGSAADSGRDLITICA